MGVLSRVKERVEKIDEGRRVFIFVWVLMVIGISLISIGNILSLFKSMLFLVISTILVGIGILTFTFLLIVLFMSFKNRGWRDQ